MALRKPLVINSGAIQQLQAGDTLDAPVSTPDVYSMTNAEVGAITIGMPVYVSGAGAVSKAKSDASGTSKCIGVVYDASIAGSASGNICHNGVITMADWTSIIGAANLSAGSDYFVDKTTAGNLTATAPSAVGELVVYVGHALSTTELLVEPDRPILL